MIQVNSLARMCERLRRPPAALEIAIGKLGIEPALEIDGRKFYDLESEAMLAADLRHEEAERILGRAIPKE